MTCSRLFPVGGFSTLAKGPIYSSEPGEVDTAQLRRDQPRPVPGDGVSCARGQTADGAALISMLSSHGPGRIIRIRSAPTNGIRALNSSNLSVLTACVWLRPRARASPALEVKALARPLATGYVARRHASRVRVIDVSDSAGRMPSSQVPWRS